MESSKLRREIFAKKSLKAWPFPGNKDFLSHPGTHSTLPTPPPPFQRHLWVGGRDITSFPLGQGRPASGAAGFGHPSLRKWGSDPSRSRLQVHPPFSSGLHSRAGLQRPEEVGNLQSTSCLQFPPAPSKATRNCRDKEAPLGGRTDHLFVPVGDKLVAETRPSPATPVCGVCVSVCVRLGACPVERMRRQRRKFKKNNQHQNT